MSLASWRASDADCPVDAVSLSKTYTVTIPDNAPATSTIATSAAPAAGGSTAGGGSFVNGTPVTVVATHGPGYVFVNWTEAGLEVSAYAVYPFTVNGDRNLVANFARVTYSIGTSASPSAGGGMSGGGRIDSGGTATVAGIWTSRRSRSGRSPTSSGTWRRPRSIVRSSDGTVRHPKRFA